jgi:hypothetical protein
VALASYALVWWALKQGFLGESDDIRAAMKEVKRLSKRKSGDGGESGDDAERARKLNNLMHRKWLAFGGGFYGVVALLTYAVVEINDIRGFVARYDGLAGLLAQLNMGIFFELMVDAVTNFVVAIAWPVYWIGDVSGAYVWIWFIVAYGGYWLGVRHALRRAQQKADRLS